MSLRDDINIPVVIVLGIVTGLIVAVAIIGTQAGYNYVSHAEVERNYREAEANGSLNLGKRVWAEQEAAMNDPAKGWATTQKTAVRMPIDRAEQLLIENKGAIPQAE